MTLFSIEKQHCLQQEYEQWVEAELQANVGRRKAVWSESIAIGSKKFIKRMQRQLGLRVRGRSIHSEHEGIVLKESPGPYNTLFDGKNSLLRPDNSYFLDRNDDIS